MENPVLAISTILFIAFLAEAVTEYLLGEPFKARPRLAPYSWLLVYVAAAVGVGLCLFYKLDLVSLFGWGSATIVGEILTGLAMGRGSNWLHQFMSKFFPAK